MFIYCSLTKERPWAEHLTSLPKRGVGTLLSVSAINHERAPMYIYSDSLPTNSLKVWTYNGAAGLGSSRSDGTQHSEWQNATMSML